MVKDDSEQEHMPVAPETLTALVSTVLTTQLNPDIQNNINLAAHLSNLPKLSVSDQEDILESFSSLASDLEDSLLNDAVNPHPLAYRLWHPRAQWIDSERISYTKKFEEHDTFFRPLASHPKAQRLVEENPEGIF